MSGENRAQRVKQLRQVSSGQRLFFVALCGFRIGVGFHNQSIGARRSGSERKVHKEEPSRRSGGERKREQPSRYEGPSRSGKKRRRHKDEGTSSSEEGVVW